MTLLIKNDIVGFKSIFFAKLVILKIQTVSIFDAYKLVTINVAKHLMLVTRNI